MGLVAPRHVASSQTRARTRVPCIGRQILNHCATREAPACFIVSFLHPCTHFFLFNYLFIFGCIGSLLLRAGFSCGARASHCGAQASHYGGFSCCGAQALGERASVVVACGLSSCGSRALERRLSRACGLSSCGSRALERRLSSCGTWA